MLVTEILTLLWLMVALMTWLLTHLKSRKDYKVSNTVQIVNNLSTVEHLLKADLKVRDELRSGNELDPHSLDKGIEEKLIMVLDYYEFLAQLYWDGSVDRLSMLHLRGKLIVDTFNASSDYIEYWRTESGRPDLYRQLQELSKDFASRSNTW